MKDKFSALTTFLKRVPGVKATDMGTGKTDNGMWWVKFSIDIHNPLVWSVIQELSFVVNNLSVTEKLPAKFYPVSPPPYLNGGPEQFLGWVIECEHPEFSPKDLCEWLEGRLPNPVDDLTKWPME